MIMFTFHNNMTFQFFAPYILQPTKPKSKTLIDNILINTVGYPSHSGNLVQISNQLLQFLILEGFFKEPVQKKIYIYEHNYQNFNERELNETLAKMNWDQILSTEGNDPNITRSVASQLIGSCEFWRICNSNLSRGKFSIPPFFHGPEVLTTSTDKANHFARNFSCNSTLDDSSQQLPNYPSYL